MEFSEEFYEKIEKYLQDVKCIEILEKLGIGPNIENIKDYISDELFGKFRGNSSIDKFLRRYGRIYKQFRFM